MKKEKKEQQGTRWIFLASLLLFVAGAGIFLYPAVSNFLAERNHENVIRTYQAAVEEENPQMLQKVWEEAKIYNENLAGDPVHDPFVAGSGYVLPDNYQKVLNVNGDGVMGYIEIPKIKVYLPIYHGTGEKELEQGAGHMDVTALPIGGEYTHAVISAHRGLPSAELFTRLDEVKEQDIFYLHILDKTLAYQVDRISVIEPEELSFLTPEHGKDMVTLLTCTPYGVNTHRLLVRGQRIPYEKEKQEAISKEEIIDTGWKETFKKGTALGLILLLMILFFVFVYLAIKSARKGRKKKKRRQK